MDALGFRAWEETLMKLMKAAALATLLLQGTSAYAGQPTVEVLHYWTSGGESAAINVFKDAFTKAGGKWIDSPVAGGGGDAMNAVLRSRHLANDRPDVAILKGPNVTEWRDLGVLANLSDVAEQDHWDKILPPLLYNLASKQWKYGGVPFDIHRVDWMWINPALLAKVGGQPPKTWDEFNTLADKLLAAGITPLAYGGQPWQDATVFEVVALGIGGPDFYRKAFVDADPDTLRSDTMIKVFDQMRRMRKYVDPNFAGRDWNLATAMVINGQAAIQIMGDWAKGEFTAAGKAPGKDYLCVPAPGTGYILNSDSFGMFDSKDPDRKAGRELLAHTILQEDVQIDYVLKKGSIPARLGVDTSRLDACAKKSVEDLNRTIASNEMVPSMAHEMATSSAIRGAFLAVVTEFFNSDMSSKDATDRLVNEIALAR
jgi:glucose/mannose transport system substrate-binding protein